MLIIHTYFGQREQRSINIDTYQPWLITCLGLLTVTGPLTNQKHGNHDKMCECNILHVFKASLFIILSQV